MRLDPPGLQSLWSASASNTGGVPWKAGILHKLGSGGAYTVLFDVPSAPIESTEVRVMISKVSSRYQVNMGHFELSVLDRRRESRKRSGGPDTPATNHRRCTCVAASFPGRSPSRSPSPETAPTSGRESPGSRTSSSRTNTPQLLDVAPGRGRVLELDYDPKTRVLSHRGKTVAGPKSVGWVTFEGTGSKRGKFRLKVSSVRRSAPARKRRRESNHRSAP